MVELTPLDDCESNEECAPGNYCVFLPVYCGAVGTCQPRPSCDATASVTVCGCDGLSYNSDTCAGAAGEAVAFGGACASYTKGDVDLDSQVNIFDVILAVNMTIDIEPESLHPCSDHDEDGRITVFDVISIVNTIVGLYPDEFPEQPCGP